MKTDIELQKNVMDELKWQSSIKSSDIGVSVTKGMVTLSGTVDNFTEKRAAERAASNVAGVKAVVENITVNLGWNNKKSDIEIAEAAVNALKWNTNVPKDLVKVKVENGWITTEGQVDWLFEKNAVHDALANIIGITGVSNLVHIKPTVNVVDLKKSIISAFERSATIDADTIEISHEGDKVILTGTVRSFAEKENAEDAVWNAPGVSAVENHLEVKVSPELKLGRASI